MENYIFSETEKIMIEIHKMAYNDKISLPKAYAILLEIKRGVDSIIEGMEKSIGEK